MRDYDELINMTELKGSSSAIFTDGFRKGEVDAYDYIIKKGIKLLMTGKLSENAAYAVSCILGIATKDMMDIVDTYEDESWFNEFYCGGGDPDDGAES